MSNTLSIILVCLLCAVEIGVLVYLLIKVSKEEPAVTAPLPAGKKQKFQQQQQQKQQQQQQKKR